MADRQLNRLRAAVDQKDAEWLDQRYPDVANALHAEVEDGATPGEVREFAREMCGNEDWFARKMVNASRHIQGTLRKRR